MIRWLLLLALMPCAALAQTVGVRTAEHDGFTRIALDFQTRPDWSLDQVDDRLMLKTDGAAKFDFTDAYHRISRRRIKTFRETSPGVLQIDLACECGASTFTYGPGSLVIDISEGTPPIQRRADPVTAITVPDLLPGILTQNVSHSDDVKSGRAIALRALLEKQLAGTPETPPAPSLPTDTAPSPETVEQEQASNTRFETRIERDERGYEIVPSPISCPAFAKDTLSGWVQARDSLPPDADQTIWLTAEARRLIALGFGAEAEALLKTVSAPEASLLREMARLMDEAVAAPGITKAADCGPLMALMALMADPPTFPARIPPIVVALQTAPDGVRPYLTARALSGLRAHGRVEDAIILRNTLSTIVVSPPATRPADAAEGDLQEMVARRTPEAADAMRLLIGTSLDEGTVPDAVIVDQARALLPELEGTSKTRLQRIIILAEVAQGSFERALDGIALLADAGSSTVADLNQRVFAGIMSLNDAAFLRQMARLSERPIVAEDQRLAVARRVAALHVPSLALDILAHSNALPTNEERLLRAEIALAMEQPELVNDLLIALDGIEAAGLRDEAADLIAAREPKPIPASPALSDSATARGARLVETSAALRAEMEAFLAE